MITEQGVLLTPLHDVDCKNTNVLPEKARKVVGIEFISNKEFIASCNDSRARLFAIGSAELISKYKGHSNQKHMIRVSYK